MKCTHCNGEHPDGFKFCPVTGKEIVQSKKACTNPECIDFEKYILPFEAKYCPKCGQEVYIQNAVYKVKNTTSYALGMSIAYNMLSSGITCLNLDDFVAGARAMFSESEFAMSFQEATELLDKFYSEIRQRD